MVSSHFKNIPSIYTSCYDVIDTDQNGSTCVQGHFLIARQSPMTKKWRVMNVLAGQGQDSHLYEYMNSGMGELSTLEVMTALSQYERDMETRGCPKRGAFRYANAQFYREAATQFYIAFDQDSGRATFVEDGAFPVDGGTYDARDIERISLAFERAAYASDAGVRKPIMEQMMDAYEVDIHSFVNMGAVFQNVENRLVMRQITEDCEKIVSTFVDMISEKQIDIYCRDRKKPVAGTQKISKLIAHARSTVASADDLMDNEFKEFLEDFFKSSEFYMDVLRLQLAFRRHILSHKDAPTNNTLQKEFDKLLVSYCFDDNTKKIQLERAVLDIERIELPKALRQAAKDISNLYNQYRATEEEIRDHAARKGVKARVIKMVGMTPSN